MPDRADNSAFGSIPVAAFRYCQPLTAATGQGWYVYPPITFALQWDGADTLWSYEGADAWFPLSAAQYPGFVDRYDAVAPEYAKGYSPMFLADSPRRGVIQVWSGLFARTAPGWALKIRPLVNYPVPRSFEPFEAIVETDEWFGPLFTNIRLVQKNRPIIFSSERPLFQVYLVNRESYSADVYARCVLHESPLSFSEADWRDYEKTLVEPNRSAERRRGEYAKRIRKRDRKE